MKRLRNFFKWVRRPIEHWFRPKYKTVIVTDELPRHLKRERIYILDDDGYEWQASLLCPCGCKQVLHMNLLEDEYPFWKVQRHDDGSISLSPSIRRKRDCQSHFWFRNGQVIWCHDSSPVH
ncbi:hypothetical protein MJD09_07065 [bacterium]|nr:hypothetical protein [bacterium]